jgi:pilus assembly protein Flp/PilA
MNALLQRAARFFKAEAGPTAVEYAVMIALIFLACLATIILVGQSTTGSFTRSGSEIQSHMQDGK